jgi:hypothetical protein
VLQKTPDDRAHIEVQLAVGRGGGCSGRRNVFGEGLRARRVFFPACHFDLIIRLRKINEFKGISE